MRSISRDLWRGLPATRNDFAAVVSPVPVPSPLTPLLLVPPPPPPLQPALLQPLPPLELALPGGSECPFSAIDESELDFFVGSSDLAKSVDSVASDERRSIMAESDRVFFGAGGMSTPSGLTCKAVMLLTTVAKF